MSDFIQRSQDGPVSILSLNRPERHNSLIPEFLKALSEALNQVKGRAGVRAMVLQANGPSFSTGGDLNGFARHLDSIATYASETVGLLNQVILSLIDLPHPVVTAVHGIVSGGSMGLVAASDIVLVSPEASFRPYYSVVGFSPDGGWTALLPGLIGAKRSADTLLTNRMITAEDALSWGLANQIIPSRKIRTAALELAHTIAGMQTGSLLRTKRLLCSDRARIAAKLEMERQQFIRQISTEETQRSMLAFLERMRA